MTPQPKRRKTVTVSIGSVLIGSRHPVVIQSMTNTPTANVSATVKQALTLMKAGAELVRLTVNNEAAAAAIPLIIKQLKKRGYETPLIGDFHFNGHRLLKKYPQTAQALAKYRINPGNVGPGKHHDENFAAFVKTALKYNKPIRIGVNGGSLDQDILTKLLSRNTKKQKPQDIQAITRSAMIKSALRSAAYAMRLGMKKNKIVLSIKTSNLQDLLIVNRQLARQCDFPIHLGLTEAGGGHEGIIASTAALSILLQEGIGDTIRISLTPQPHTSRSLEVETCKTLLQSLGLRHFEPHIISCPGCGRTRSHAFQKLAADVRYHVKKRMASWRQKFPGVENLRIAVMGCVVNGPGESRHADIGISLPGDCEKPSALVFVKGKRLKTLKGKNMAEKFIKILERYIKHTYTG